MPMMGGYWPELGGYGPMKGACKGKKSGPYGFSGKGGGKSKGKPKGAASQEKPVVNPNQINPSKDMFDGGISFKNILQEKVSKQIHRPIQPGDLVYTCTRGKGGRHCTLGMPCLGEDQPPFESDQPDKDEKAAGQRAAAKALEALFPTVHAAVLEAYSGGEGSQVDPNGEPKGLLNRNVQLMISRPVEKTDVVYETKWRHDINGYHCIVRLNGLDGGSGTHVYESDLSGKFTDAKLAEKSAARQALAANAEAFDAAMAANDSKKAAEAAKAQKGFGKGFSKGKGKGFGKPFGKW